ncbi:CPBP family intramembrane glutamic endopeptidase [Burkholderia gladioli]|uniref:CPBP family intramembrane glutamic endopeptidase n=1 Tax=Burkholderia gladioli TaxID=28095 RepID=UPI00163F2B46|nr:type II CAAX endopeptidase family protein [Burkholderia gladioli]
MHRGTEAIHKPKDDSGSPTAQEPSSKFHSKTVLPNKNIRPHVLHIMRLPSKKIDEDSLTGTGKKPIGVAWRMALFIATFVLIDVVLTIILGHFLKRPSNDATLALSTCLATGAVNLSAVASATAVLATLEKKSWFDYGLAGSARTTRFLSGIVCGFTAISALILVLWKTGLIRVEWAEGQAWKYAGAWAAAFIMAAVFEESLLRGYLQATLTRRIGFWPALAVLSLIFGLLHATSSSENFVGILNAIVLGLILCLTLRYTGSLWWAIGFHAAWDWGESAVYGAADSGSIVQHAIFTTRPLGQVLLSGGSAGPEGSLLILPLMGLLALCIWSRWSAEFHRSRQALRTDGMKRK